jgi:ABC-type uncharacterized transport system permease subunit
LRLQDITPDGLVIRKTKFCKSRLVPLPAVRRVLAIAGIAAVLLTLAFPGDARLSSANPWAPMHWVLGVASYGLFGVAVLHGSLLDAAERRMRNKLPGDGAVLGMPLLRLERPFDSSRPDSSC